MKSVVIYTYYMSPSSDYNLSFFVKTELTYKENIDYIIVINGHKYNKTICFPILDNLKIIKRENKGFDFGGHKSALEYIDNEKKEYDYYFFMNSGVVGPILPHYFTGSWLNIFIKKINDKVKLVGTTIACLPHDDLGGYGPKVEGFFFMTDKIGLSLLKNWNKGKKGLFNYKDYLEIYPDLNHLNLDQARLHFENHGKKEGRMGHKPPIFYNHSTKISAIIYGEYALSKCILENGYTIDCMIPKYQKTDWLNINNHSLNKNKHPSRKNSFYGNSINPYDVVFHKWHWHGEPKVNFEIIQQYIDGKTLKKEHLGRSKLPDEQWRVVEKNEKKNRC